MKRTAGLAVSFVLAALLAGCNFPLLAQDQANEADLVGTAVAQTIQALHSQPQATEVPAEPTPIEPTATSIPPQPTSPGVMPPTATPNACNRAKFIAETIPDDSAFAPGEIFTKSWTFENSGTCTWTTDYKLFFIGGSSMEAPAAVNLPASTAPGAQVKIEVPMKAPADAGTYRGDWSLQSPDNDQFFPVYVQIKTESVTFAVTSVFTNLADVSPGSCPHTYAVDISITANAAGKVTYQTETSEGAVSALKSITFDEAGTQIAELDWGGLGVDGDTTDYWLKVFIAQPNNQPWNPFYFTVTCP